MVELIIVLLKQLLQIPEDPNLMIRGERSLQKRLLSTYAQEHVLDLFVFMTQEFKDPLHQKLTMHFLEIQYQILKNFRPNQIINRKQVQQEALSKLTAQEEARKRQEIFVRSMRHGKFGFQTQIKKDDGTLVRNANIYA